MYPFITLPTFLEVPSFKALRCALLCDPTSFVRIILSPLLTSHLPRPRHLAMTTISRDSFEATVIRICRERKLNHCYDANYHAHLPIGSYVIKYDYYKSLEPQVKTQRHVYDYAQTQENAPRIPKVEYFFRDDEGIGYLVMERVTLLPTPKNLAERTAEALNWLALVPAPSNHAIGPLRVLSTIGYSRMVRPLWFSRALGLSRYI
jgi:hypothetical protein